MLNYFYITDIVYTQLNCKDLDLIIPNLQWESGESPDPKAAITQVHTFCSINPGLIDENV